MSATGFVFGDLYQTMYVVTAPEQVEEEDEVRLKK